jgi:hypothetical protein
LIGTHVPADDAHGDERLVDAERPLTTATPRKRSPPTTMRADLLLATA